MADREQPQAAGPPGQPPASIESPAAAGQPDEGRLLMVRLNSWTVGDLGHVGVDLQILDAILTQNGRVGQWLTAGGFDRARLHQEFGTPANLDDMLEQSGR